MTTNYFIENIAYYISTVKDYTECNIIVDVDIFHLACEFQCDVEIIKNNQQEICDIAITYDEIAEIYYDAENEVFKVKFSEEE